MAPFSLRVILVHFFLFIFSTGIAQNYTVKESTSSTPDALHDLFHPTAGCFVVIEYSSSGFPVTVRRSDKEMRVTGYDKNLRQIYSSPVKELKGAHYLGGVENNGHLYVFYTANNKTFKAELDPARGSLVASPEEACNAGKEYFDFYKGFSADSAYCYAVTRSREQQGKDDFYNGVVMDRNMRILTKFSFKLEGISSYTASNDFVITHDGVLHVISAVRIKPAKDNYRPMQYLISEVSPEGKTATNELTGLPEGWFNDVVWSASDKGLYFIGLLAKTKKTGYKTIITGEYESSQKKVTGIKEMDLNSIGVLQNAADENLKKIAKEGIPTEENIIASYTLPDRSMVLLLQQTEVLFTIRGNFSYYDTKAYNLCMIKLNPEKQLENIGIIPIRQMEPTQPLYSGCISAQNGKGDIFLFFHDNEKNESAKAGADKDYSTTLGTSTKYNHVAAVCIHRDGTVSKKFVIDDKDSNDYLLAPSQAFAVHNDEITYTSFDLSRFFGKSSYRIGYIKIN